MADHMLEVVIKAQPEEAGRLVDLFRLAASLVPSLCCMSSFGSWDCQHGCMILLCKSPLVFTFALCVSGSASRRADEEGRLIGLFRLAASLVPCHGFM